MDPDGTALVTAACITLFAVRFFFSCCGAALDRIGESRLRAMETEGKHSALCSLLRDPYMLLRVFNAHKLVNTAIFVPLAISALEKAFPENDAAVILLAAAAVILLFAAGDCLPEGLYLSEGFAAVCAPAVRVLAVLMSPVTATGSIFSRLVPPADDSGASDSVTEEEILMMVDAGSESGSIESSEKEMIAGVFEFHDMAVSDVMTHRTDIVAVSEDAEISQAVYTAMNSGFSRIPVYSGSVDSIKGIIYVKDLLCLIGTQSAEGFTVKTFLRDAEFVPESCPCDELFRTFTAGHIQMAVAVDEYGGTAGLVTMEDLIEAIVGNIQDEYDNETEDMTRISDDTCIISGSARAGDVMESLGCPLPDDSEYDTMSGFLTDILGRIPADGETPVITYENILFTVLLTEDMRIIKIKAVKSANKTEEKEPDK